MDAGNGRATIAQMGDCADYTHAVFLRGRDGSARLKCASRSNDFYFARRLLFRTKSFRAQQPRGSGLLSSLLEYQRTLFGWVSTLIRRSRRNHIVCRPSLWIFAPLGCTRSFFATDFVTWAKTYDAHWFRMALSRDLRFARGLDRFVAIHPLVLSYRYADFFVRELSRRPDCLLRSRGRIALAHLDVVAAMARRRFQ